jgi:hypothetical protein
MVNGIATLHRPSFHHQNGIIHQSTTFDSHTVQLYRHRQLAMVEYSLYLQLSLSKGSSQ